MIFCLGLKKQHKLLTDEFAAVKIGQIVSSQKASKFLSAYIDDFVHLMRLTRYPEETEVFKVLVVVRGFSASSTLFQFFYASSGFLACICRVWRWPEFSFWSSHCGHQCENNIFYHSFWPFLSHCFSKIWAKKVKLFAGVVWLELWITTTITI